MSLAACSDPEARLLPASLPLRLGADKSLTAAGRVLPKGPDCDGSGADGAMALTAVVDSGLPLSAYRPGRSGSTRALDDRILLGPLSAQGGAGPVRAILCDAPMIALGQEEQAWKAGSTAVNMVVGGDVLRRLAMQLSFGKEPSDPTCNQPPCLRLAVSDISDNCELAARGEAVLPFSLRGGDLLVQLGSEVLAYPPTRAVVSACVEPAADPQRAPTVDCIDQARLRARVAALQSESTSLKQQAEVLPLGSAARCALRVNEANTNQRRNVLQQLDALLLQANATCPKDGAGITQLPTPVSSGADELLRSECPGQSAASLPTLPDLIEAEALRAAPYLPSGTDARLLISSATPGLVLSLSLFGRLRGQQAADALAQKPSDATLALPGLADAAGWKVTLGATDATRLQRASLALVSRERHLSPCAELARGRRQRYGLPAPTAGQTACAQAACLQDLQRDPQQTQRRCAYSGQNLALACTDRGAPMAAVLELPVLDALVVPDASAALQAINGDLRSGGNPQVDGILGVPVLERLAAEIDLAGGRLIGHCRCNEGDRNLGCRAYPRATYHDSDDCATNGSLQVSAEPVAPVQCRN